MLLTAALLSTTRQNELMRKLRNIGQVFDILLGEKDVHKMWHSQFSELFLKTKWLTSVIRSKMMQYQMRDRLGGKGIDILKEKDSVLSTQFFSIVDSSAYWNQTDN